MVVVKQMILHLLKIMIRFLTASKHQIGMKMQKVANSEPYDGYLSEFHFVDGTIRSNKALKQMITEFGFLKMLKMI